MGRSGQSTDLDICTSAIRFLKNLRPLEFNFFQQKIDAYDYTVISHFYVYTKKLSILLNVLAQWLFFFGVPQAILDYSQAQLIR